LRILDADRSIAVGNGITLRPEWSPYQHNQTEDGDSSNHDSYGTTIVSFG
jgi:hypothetical protein